ncbi:MAG: hypothetical protein EOO08_00570 [Chitinophagaceae bacterium]|nr:MAG: hypothetical protein EOO08_00570 [Chitinophagaceae bacterium]
MGRLFKTEEDSFTSSIFELLTYLPKDILWEVLTAASSVYHEQHLPAKPSPLLSFEFWPHWNPDSTENVNFVEPDLLLEFEDYHIIVEAKRDDFGETQWRGQWEKEVTSYCNQYQETFRKDVYLLAVAGLRPGQERQQAIKVDVLERFVPVSFTRWKDIRNVVLEITARVAKEPISVYSGVLHVLNSLLLAFRVHGFSSALLLNTLPQSYQINYTNLPRL